jgi:hypothetical protein
LQWSEFPERLYLPLNLFFNMQSFFVREFIYLLAPQ